MDILFKDWAKKNKRSRNRTGDSWCEMKTKCVIALIIHQREHQPLFWSSSSINCDLFPSSLSDRPLDAASEAPASPSTGSFLFYIHSQEKCRHIKHRWCFFTISLETLVTSPHTTWHRAKLWDNQKRPRNKRRHIFLLISVGTLNNIQSVVFVISESGNKKCISQIVGNIADETNKNTSSLISFIGNKCL